MQFQSEKFTICLCGNPNSGKTTLFNALTGSNQKVGNWTGVTVEKKSGTLKNSFLTDNTSLATDGKKMGQSKSIHFSPADGNINIVDTPGIYSLTPATIDEQIALDFLQNSHVDIIINIVDSTNLLRNLYLTSQLAELGIKMVVALNMQDEAEARGIYIDKQKLEKHFKCKFFDISASKSIGIQQLVQYCVGLLEKSSDTDKSKAKKQVVSFSFDGGQEKTSFSTMEKAKKNDGVVNLANMSPLLAQKRFDGLEVLVKDCLRVDKSKIKPMAVSLTEKIDNIVLNKWLAFPIFAIVMILVFFLSMGGLGALLSRLINEKFTPFVFSSVESVLAFSNSQWLVSLVTEGILKGVLSVIAFLPQIMLLFGFISILEASGYMSRIAFIMDCLLDKIGLGGKSFVSMILGCGCTVPAIMATRTIKNLNQRNTTITLTPFMPCSAKMAIISFFTAKILNGNAFVAVSFYFISIFSVILGGLVLKMFNGKKQAEDIFILELPNFRLPTFSNVTKQMWERGKAFLVKAGTVILVASVVLWFLQSFNFKFQYVENAEQSIIASIGKLIAPLFAPLGFNDWRFAVATLSGISAKETVVSTLEILLGQQQISDVVSPLSAYCFVVYNLLTVPCVSAVSASFSEQASFFKGAKSLMFQFFMAYFVSMAIFQLGQLAQNHLSVFVTVLVLIVLGVCIYFSTDYLLKSKSTANCCHCKQKNNCTLKSKCNDSNCNCLK